MGEVFDGLQHFSNLANNNFKSNSKCTSKFSSFVVVDDDVVNNIINFGLTLHSQFLPISKSKESEVAGFSHWL